jgi:hypothetical protein
MVLYWLRYKRDLSSLPFFRRRAITTLIAMPLLVTILVEACP